MHARLECVLESAAVLGDRWATKGYKGGYDVWDVHGKNVAE